MRNAEFTLYVASERGNRANTVYPKTVRVGDIQKLEKAVTLDHVCAEYKDGHRSERNFIAADCIPMDCDNDDSENPADWKTPDDVRAAFPSVIFYAVTSRNHMKIKDGKAARPKYHYYFPIDKVSNAKEYVTVKRTVWEIFPNFDKNALDAARFFFGNEFPEIKFFDGDINLTEFLNKVENQEPEPIQPLTGNKKTGSGEPIIDNDQDFGQDNSQTRKNKGTIKEGERNNTLSRKAAQLLKRYGDTDETRRRFDEVCSKCEPRLNKSEEDTIYTSAQQFFHNVVKQSPAYKSPDQFDAPPFAVPTDKGYVISPPLLCDYYLERHTIIIVTDSGSPRVYEYNGGVYEYRAEHEIKAVLGAYISEFRRGLWSSAKIAEAYTAILLTAKLYVTQSQLNANPNIVCLKNGLLNLKEWKLYPHSADKYYTAQLDCDFTENIPETPVFDTTLHVYCEGSAAKQRFILQYQGAVFSNVPGYKFKRFLLTIGEKDSGKTIMKRLTEIFVGEGNYNNCDLADLENNRFAAASLHLKRLSGTNDLRSAKIPEVGRLLQLTGGDSMRVERKGEQDFSMIYTGYIWHVGNNKPVYGGRQNDALYLREILFELNHTIPQAEQDHNLLEKLIAERQGIILKCLFAARKAIYENGYRFDVPAECDRSKKEHKHSNNIVSQFLEECTQKLDFSNITKREAEKHTSVKIWQAFKAWRDYCGEYKGLTRSDFEQELAGIYGVDIKTIRDVRRIGDITGRFYPVMLNEEGIRYSGDIFL